MFDFIKCFYTKSNHPNVWVHYGEKRFIKVDAHSKAYITEGICDVYCKVHADYEKHIENVLEEAEINNKTKFPIYIELKECLLTDSRQGDLTLNILPKL